MGRLNWTSLLLLAAAVARAAEDAPSPPANNPMQDPAMMQSALKMMQNPQMMEHMKVMMKDPAVKERMKRMLQKLGPSAAIGGGAAATDDEAIEAIWERMQAALADPERLQKLSETASSEQFQSRMKQLAEDPEFASAAGEYVDEMKEELSSELLAGRAGAAGEAGLALDDEDDEEEEDAGDEE